MSPTGNVIGMADMKEMLKGQLNNAKIYEPGTTNKTGTFEDSKSKSIGAFALFLTVVSVGFSVIIALQISLSLSQQVADQLQIYQGY